jgi:hypothetical protein
LLNAVTPLATNQIELHPFHLEPLHDGTLVVRNLPSRSWPRSSVIRCRAHARAPRTSEIGNQVLHHAVALVQFRRSGANLALARYAFLSFPERNARELLSR